MARFLSLAPCLWFDAEAEEAAKFYVSVFDNSKILRVLHYSEAGHEIHGKPAGSVLTVDFELDGHKFTALNGGPQFKFSEAISLQVTCESQQEVDFFWKKLSEGGEKGRCGWLKDRYGLSWQVTPAALTEMLDDPDKLKRVHVTNAALTMDKLEIKELEKAYLATE